MPPLQQLLQMQLSCSLAHDASYTLQLAAPRDLASSALDNAKQVSLPLMQLCTKVVSVAGSSCFVLMSQCTTLNCSTIAKGVTTAPCTSNVAAFLQLWIECTNYFAVTSSTWSSPTAFDMCVSCCRYRRSSAARAGCLQIACLPYLVQINSNMTVTCRAAAAAVATASAALQGWCSCAAT